MNYLNWINKNIKVEQSSDCFVLYYIQLMLLNILKMLGMDEEAE